MSKRCYLECSICDRTDNPEINKARGIETSNFLIRTIGEFGFGQFGKRKKYHICSYCFDIIKELSKKKEKKNVRVEK
jgi:hypothetical protein